MNLFYSYNNGSKVKGVINSKNFKNSQRSKNFSNKICTVWHPLLEEL